MLIRFEVGPTFWKRKKNLQHHAIPLSPPPSNRCLIAKDVSCTPCQLSSYFWIPFLRLSQILCLLIFSEKGYIHALKCSLSLVVFSYRFLSRCFQMSVSVACGLDIYNKIMSSSQNKFRWQQEETFFLHGMCKHVHHANILETEIPNALMLCTWRKLNWRGTRSRKCSTFLFSSQTMYKPLSYTRAYQYTRTT